MISNTAIPRADCRFQRWDGVASTLATNNPLAFSLTNAHPNVMARFVSLRPDGVVIQFK